MDMTTHGSTPEACPPSLTAELSAARPLALASREGAAPAIKESEDDEAPVSKSWRLKVAVILLVILISIAFAGLIWSMIL